MPEARSLSASTPQRPSDAAIGYAFDTADRHGSDLRACYITPAQPGDRTAQGLLDEVLAAWRARYPYVTVRSDVVHGAGPARLLLLEAADASLLVVGCRRQDGLQRLLAGSVSHTLVHHSTTPLLVASARATTPVAHAPTGT
ncbi:universal stress protein [Dactylosporangium sp. NBC_01737]|uniref:universal stress protein n=1 Tax=Dactylosporangium sp. NBC_01737 TaxID=2975959 RepID=UPI002E1166F8|nr:universal stress protein [Dactylosporangium sp. NBC_01737]